LERVTRICDPNVDLQGNFYKYVTLNYTLYVVDCCGTFCFSCAWRA